MLVFVLILVDGMVEEEEDGGEGGVSTKRDDELVVRWV